jgi:RimJ/RimL family protein N-acetyltransferase
VALVHPDWINRTAETASWMLKEYRGQGYGSEAKHLLLEYAFDRLGLRMLESWVRFENTRSAAALRKQGYREAGAFAWTSYRDARFTSFIVFDLLASEWRDLKTS